jgi:hypothetical protein
MLYLASSHSKEITLLLSCLKQTTIIENVSQKKIHTRSSVPFYIQHLRLFDFEVLVKSCSIVHWLNYNTDVFLTFLVVLAFVSFE